MRFRCVGHRLAIRRRACIPRYRSAGRAASPLRLEARTLGRWRGANCRASLWRGNRGAGACRGGGAASTDGGGGADGRFSGGLGAVGGKRGGREAEPEREDRGKDPARVREW